jgi:uncharacterized protein
MEKPKYANGKICYLEIPAKDIETSSAFYKNVFGWHIRKDNHGFISFDDTVGEVSGMWVTGPKPISEAGIIISIMVADAKASIDLIVKHGGIIVKEIDTNASEITAHFTDPAGNIFGIYEHRSL